MKQVVDDSTNRMKTTQGEINRLEAAILDNAEKLRKSQVGSTFFDIHESFCEFVKGKWN